MKDPTTLQEILTAERNYGEAKILFKNKNSCWTKIGILKILSTIFITNQTLLSQRATSNLPKMILEYEDEIKYYFSSKNVSKINCFRHNYLCLIYILMSWQYFINKKLDLFLI